MQDGSPNLRNPGVVGFGKVKPCITHAMPDDNRETMRALGLSPKSRASTPLNPKKTAGPLPS